MKTIVSGMLMLGLLMGACTQVPEEPMEEWVHLADFPGTARASGAAFVIDDKAYVCCGRTELDAVFLNEFWKYDQTTDRWTQLDSFPGKRRVKPVGVAIDGKAYVGMGASSDYEVITVYKDFYVFDPVTGAWTELASFPGEASNDLAFAVIDGCLYTAMGFTGSVRSNEVYKYDPASNRWTRLKDCPSKYSATASFSIGSDFFVAGGFQGRNIRTMFRYDTQKNDWSFASSMPEGRVLSVGLEVSGKGYVMLGRFWAGAENNGRLLSDIVEYDSATDSWTRRGDFPGAPRQNAFVFEMDGKGYIVMGENDGQRLNDVWCFKP